MADKQHYLGRFSYVGTSNEFAVDGTNVDLDADDYYLFGYDSEATDQFIEHVQTQIRAAGANYSNSTVTYDWSSGVITIAFIDAASAPFTTNLVWSDTDLRDLLGFAGNLSGADTYFAESQPRYIWRPSNSLSDYPGDLPSWWAPRSTSRGFRSADGYTNTTQGSLLYDGRFNYTMLTDDEVIDDGSNWESFERFWLDVAHAGQPIRCYPDRSANTSSDYETAILMQEAGGPLGSWADYRRRHVRSYQGLWDVSFFLAKYVT